MSHYHLNQELALCRSTTLGCWTGIAPTTTSKTQCSVGPIIVPSEYSPHQCFGVPCWYNTGPCYATCTLLPVLWPISSNRWLPLSCNRTTLLVQRRANAISSQYEHDVGPTLGQCLQLVLFIYKYALFPVDFSDLSELSNRGCLDYSKQIKTW